MADLATGVVNMVRDSEFLDSLFDIEIIQRPELKCIEYADWPIDSAKDFIDKLRSNYVVRREQRGGNSLSLLVRQCAEGSGVFLMNVTVSPGMVRMHVAATTQDVLENLFKQLDRAKRQPLVDEVRVKFWTAADAYTRKIAVAPWNKINVNYPGTGKNDSGAGLDYLFKQYKPEQAGQLILWHGEPGTGKTTALRSLGWEWRDWCSLSYIVDPEQFFGGNADYMLRVLLNGNSPEYGPDPEDTIDITDAAAEAAFVAKRKSRRERWQLLICEDTGELLASDAKERSGQGLSRLLNIVDGMIGQGLRVMVLVTTNETVDKLHPAVARPGRAGSIIEFGRFTAMQAKQWLMEHGVGAYNVPAKGMTLAELYSVVEGRERVEVKTSFGFAA